MEVRAAIRGERDELPVELDALRQAAAELGQQVCHLPAPAAASSEAGVCADQAAEPVDFGSNIQPRPRGIVPARASMGWGSRNTTSLSLSRVRARWPCHVMIGDSCGS